MAKRGRSRGTGRTAQAAIGNFAEDLGRLLGTARAKADTWLSQRETIAKNLTQIRDTAAGLLSQLGDQAAAVVNRARAGTAKQRTAGAPPIKRKRRTMSAAARARISAAQKARWAKLKKT